MAIPANTWQHTTALLNVVDGDLTIRDEAGSVAINQAGARSATVMSPWGGIECDLTRGDDAIIALGWVRVTPWMWTDVDGEFAAQVATPGTPAATVAEQVIVGRRVRDYVAFPETRRYDLTGVRRNVLQLSPAHRHSTDAVVGYVVRRTVSGGGLLWHLHHDPDGVHRHGGIGIDVRAIEGAGRYATARDAADDVFTAGDYAIVDRLYDCGCRSF